MKEANLTYLLLGLLVCFYACDLTNSRPDTSEIELINKMGENVYFGISDAETASLIDILPFTEPEKISLPALPDNESVVINLTEIEGFQIDKLDQGIHIILYMIRDNFRGYPEPIAVAGHYGNISYNELTRNQGRIILKNR